eukprot:TRINITY_DN19435_c0_g2_i1.p1 TRINITY_DN19435_c0_g2~~TRINITY_DN19435_c0_g2_i1.p1  ORF type:complete len:524 (-),score=71.92 TRINITY_DN19435_c0_g2_i1:10-1581(-)
MDFTDDDDLLYVIGSSELPTEQAEPGGWTESLAPADFSLTQAVPTTVVAPVASAENQQRSISAKKSPELAATAIQAVYRGYRDRSFVQSRKRKSTTESPTNITSAGAAPVEGPTSVVDTSAAGSRVGPETPAKTTAPSRSSSSSSSSSTTTATTTEASPQKRQARPSIHKLHNKEAELAEKETALLKKLERITMLERVTAQREAALNERSGKLQSDEQHVTAQAGIILDLEERLSRQNIEMFQERDFFEIILCAKNYCEARTIHRALRQRADHTSFDTFFSVEGSSPTSEFFKRKFLRQRSMCASLIQAFCRSLLSAKLAKSRQTQLQTWIDRTVVPDLQRREQVIRAKLREIYHRDSTGMLSHKSAPLATHLLSRSGPLVSSPRRRAPKIRRRLQQHRSAAQEISEELPNRKLGETRKRNATPTVAEPAHNNIPSQQVTEAAPTAGVRPPFGYGAPAYAPLMLPQQFVAQPFPSGPQLYPVAIHAVPQLQHPTPFPVAIGVGIPQYYPQDTRYFWQPPNVPA